MIGLPQGKAGSQGLWKLSKQQSAVGNQPKQEPKTRS